MKSKLHTTFIWVALLALVALIGYAVPAEHAGTAALAACSLPILGTVFFDKDTGGGFGPDAGAMTLPDFQKAAAKTIVGIEQQNAELLKNYGNLDKDTKKAFEELTTAKNKAADDIVSLENALKKTRLQLANERHMAFGDPFLRVSADEELRTLGNALIRAWTKQPLSTDHKKALGEDSSPGSTLINTHLSRAIYDLLPEFGIWSTLEVEPIGTKTTTFPLDTADPIAQFVDEAGAISDDTNIAGSTVSMTAKKIGVLLKISRELLQDAEYDVLPRVLRKFARAMAYRMDFASFRADGTADATNGGFTGVMNFATAATATTTHTTVETLTLEDITNVLLTPAVATLTRAAKWWMHPFILIRLLSIKDSNGRPIFLTATEAPTPGGIGSILGFPVVLGNVMPTTNTAGSYVAAFGDPGAYVVGPRQDTEIAQSEHVFFANDQVGVRGIARAGFKGRLATGLARLRLAAS